MLKMYYFIHKVLTQVDTVPEEATHFVIMKGDKARYYIAIQEQVGKYAVKRLAKNISTYSRKLKLLMQFLKMLPLGLLQKVHVGKFVRLDVDEQITSVLREVQDSIFDGRKIYWNVIVGNYVDKQKLVFQCFEDDIEQASVFVKIGGENASKEMLNEIEYLKNPACSSLFSSPFLYFAKKQQKEHDFNVLVTKEFQGKKVKAKMNRRIYKIFIEIANTLPITSIDGVPYAFSHGDFTPWNMKQTAGGYVVYDWEYCGVRFYGFDLIHYLWQVESKLKGKNKKTAIRSAISKAKELDNKLTCFDDKTLESMYFTELEKQFGDVL